MKKYIRILALVLCAVMMLAIFVSCADKNKDGAQNDDGKKPELFDYENEDLSPYINLATYKGRTLEIDKIEISDADVESRIKSLLEENNVYTKITDRAAEQGDLVFVDYTGYMDGEKFSGGEAKNVMIQLAENGKYIKGFTSGIIGHTPGEEFSVEVTFPEDYGYAAYAGKQAEFVFNFHYIVKYELTDEFASTYSNGECTSADGFSDYIYKELYKPKYDDAVYNAIWNAVYNESSVISYPQSSLDYYMDILNKECQGIAKQLGMSFDDALKYLGMTMDTLTEYAQNQIKKDLIIYHISKTENRIPSDADIDSFVVYFVQKNFSYFEEEMISLGYSKTDINEESVLAYVKEKYMANIRSECLLVKFSTFLTTNNTFVEK